jgi:hypothetical protein
MEGEKGVRSLGKESGGCREIGKKGRAPRMWIDWMGVIGYRVRVWVGLD